MELKKRILVAPLNWGLGHATRCIPIVNALLEHDFLPVIASDGVALKLLKKEFPSLEFIELPAYNITYAKKGSNFKWKLILDSPKWLKAVKQENLFVKKLIESRDFAGIISDNRLGVRSQKVPSVFISHQLNVLSGSTSWFSSKMHQKIIKKYAACWVPDVAGEPNLSGKLGHLKLHKLNIKYLGVLSRFNKANCEVVYDLMVLLSGPEPQRTFLETKLLTELQEFKGEVLFVRGVVEDYQTITQKEHIKLYNFMASEELELAINQSKFVLSRSGYTTVMDLAKLDKKAFFIPTPGQYEQVYLAERLDALGLVPTCSQESFTIQELNRIKDYKGLENIKGQLVDFKQLFSLFEGKRKLTTNT